MRKKILKLTKEAKKKIVVLKRKKHHPLVHQIHKKHGISHKTLLYMKEYGPRSHVYHVIIKESLKILILASLISALGGIGLQFLNEKFITILPLLILLPALNDMIGDYGSIISSKFTAYLYTGKIKGKWWKSEYTHRMFFTVLTISIFSSLYIGLLSSGIAYVKGFQLTIDLMLKIIEISIASTLLLVAIIFTISITMGLYFYKKQEDPNNFLIPITTSIADLGSMLVFLGMMTFLF